MTPRSVRRLVRPAASRPCRARAPCEGGARARPADRARLGRSRAQARRDAGRRAAAARPRRVSRTTRSLLDEHARTVDTLRAHPEWDDPVFLIGADEFCDFPPWKEPEEVLERTRLAVATRPGFPRERLDAVLGAARAPRARRASSSSSRPRSPRASCARRLAAGEDVADDVPPAVAELIRGRDAVPTPDPVHWDRLSPIEQARRIAALAQDKLARDVVILDMRPVCAYTDFFVVCTGGNPRQTKSDLGRGARAPEEARTRCSRARPRATPRRRGSSATTSTSCCTSSPRSARVLPPRGAVGRRPARDGRSSHGLSGPVARTGNSPSDRAGRLLSVLTTNRKARRRGSDRGGLELATTSIAGDERYDLILDTGERLLRVQCKWAPARRRVMIRSSRPPGTVFSDRMCSGEFDASLRTAPTSIAATSSRTSRSTAHCNCVSDRAGTTSGWHRGSDYEFGATLPQQLGPIAQLGERAGMAEVVGSSPTGST